MLKRESEGREATGRVKSDDEGAQEEVAASFLKSLTGVHTTIEHHGIWRLLRF